MNSEKLGTNTVEKMLIAVIPIILSAIFYFLPSLLLLARMIPFLSDSQAIDFITGLEGNWLQWVLAIIGLVIGGFLSIYIYTEILKMEINRDFVVIDIFDKKTEILKSDIESVFKEGKKLVIIDKEGFELLREDTDYSAERLKNTFKKFHYPWVSQDPHAEAFFEWSVNHRDVGQRANDILYDRLQAKRDDEDKKVKELRQDLMEMGVVVKDEGNRQYIRLDNNRGSQGS